MFPLKKDESINIDEQSSESEDDSKNLESKDKIININKNIDTSIISCIHDKADIKAFILGQDIEKIDTKKMYKRIDNCAECCDYFIELDYKTGRNRSIELTLDNKNKFSLTSIIISKLQTTAFFLAIYLTQSNIFSSFLTIFVFGFEILATTTNKPKNKYKMILFTSFLIFSSILNIYFGYKLNINDYIYDSKFLYYFKIIISIYFCYIFLSYISSMARGFLKIYESRKRSYTLRKKIIEKHKK